MTNITYSDRNATNVSATVQKRHTLYISDKDPRALSGRKYQNDYYAEIVIIPDAEYRNMIKQQVGQIVDENGNEIEVDFGNIPDASEVETGLLVSTLHPPTNLYWDYSNDPTATEYISNSGSTTINIKVTFDPAIDDISGEGQILYYADIQNITGSSVPAAEPSNSTVTSPNGSTIVSPGSTSSTKFANVGAVTLAQTKTSSLIKLKWKGVKGNVIHYSIKATGSNMMNTSTGQRTRIYTTSPDVNATTGYHYWSLTPLYLRNFSGTYTFVITAQYDKGVSPVGSTFSVTI